jgi:hypothetical protein
MAGARPGTLWTLFDERRADGSRRWNDAEVETALAHLWVNALAQAGDANNHEHRAGLEAVVQLLGVRPTADTGRLAAEVGERLKARPMPADLAERIQGWVAQGGLQGGDLRAAAAAILGGSSSLPVAPGTAGGRAFDLLLKSRSR